MYLVFQGEVEGNMLDSLLREGLGSRVILLLLDVLDHVGEPHRQTVIAAVWRNQTDGRCLFGTC